MLRRRYGLVACLAVVVACASQSDDVLPDMGTGVGPDGGREPPRRAELGLDVRPTNTRCLAPARPPNAGPVALREVYGDIFGSVQSPMVMAQRPGDGSRWFLAQRNGRIVSFRATEDAGQRDLREVLSVAQLKALTGKDVTLTDESGFHALAFDPGFFTNGRLYVSFATFCDGSVPACDDPKNLNGNYYRFASEIGYLTSPDGGETFTGYTRLLHVGRWSQMHYGGGLAFGRDGLLYIAQGDGLDDSDTQRLDNFFGKVLRIDPNGTPAPGKPYGIPTSNPFAGGGGRPEIYAWGLRNPFRISVDRESGDVWLGDVGQDSWEEVDRIERGGNYGWPCREGAHPGFAANDTSKCAPGTRFIDPIVEHAHGAGGRSVTGGVVYRGGAIPGFQGTYVYGDFIQKEARGLSFDGTTWTSTILNAGGPQDGYVSFAEDADGEIYSVALFDQKIHKLVAAAPPAPSRFPQKLSETGCVLPGDPKKPAEGVLPYAVNAALWSDGAKKERWLAIPDGSTIKVGADGDFDFPNGSVLLKTFSLGERPIETRLFVRHDDGGWAGYSYEWNDAGTDATLLPAGKVKSFGDQVWTYPSRSECLLCHTGAAGRTLGLEVAQLNGDAVYPSTNRIANQLKTLSHIGLFESPIDVANAPAYPDPFAGEPNEAKARAYLHANCAGCHRPNGGGGRSTMDLRFGTPLSEANACDAPPIVDDFGDGAARLIAAGRPEKSIVSLRLRAVDGRRMPPLGRALVDPKGADLVDAWIRSATCP